jgi:hypothetical protein
VQPPESNCEVKMKTFSSSKAFLWLIHYS